LDYLLSLGEIRQLLETLLKILSRVKEKKKSATAPEFHKC
jgi:hypothetical protein